MFHETRLENLIVVYANEMAPVTSAVDAVKQALNRAPDLDDRSWAKLLFDDEMVSYSWNKSKFSKPEYEEINVRETATACPEPYLLLPTWPHEIGIVLVHGFAASPAELRAFGEKLQALNYPVIGVRLAGHGTSPWDLRDRSWDDWLDSVRRGYRIMSAFAERVCLIGFSSGGALSLLLAAEKPEHLAGVVAVAPPVIFQNKNMSYVPFIHGLNRVTNWIASFDGVKSFRKNPSEHPHINYQHMPIRGLYELHLMVEALQEKLAAIACPIAVLQGTDDPVVKPESARIIIDGLGSERKSLHMIDSKKHGVINEDIGETHETIVAFVESLS